MSNSVNNNLVAIIDNLYFLRRRKGKGETPQRLKGGHPAASPARDAGRNTRRLKRQRAQTQERSGPAKAGPDDADTARSDHPRTATRAATRAAAGPRGRGYPVTERVYGRTEGGREGGREGNILI